MLRKLSEDVSERSEYVPASFFVVRHVRPKTVIRIVNERLYFSAHNRKRDGVLGWKRSTESRSGVPKNCYRRNGSPR